MAQHDIVPSYRRQIQYASVRATLVSAQAISDKLMLTMLNAIDINGEPFAYRFTAPYIHTKDTSFHAGCVYEMQIEVRTPFYYVTRILSASELSYKLTEHYMKRVNALSFDFRQNP